ncbi:MAG: HD-GYP domain-containing protein [Thermoleophilia bacterium]
MVGEGQQFKFLVGTAVAVSTGLVVCSLTVFRFASPTVAQLWEVGLLAFLAIIGEELAVELSSVTTLAASNLPILLGIMFLGPVPAMAIAAVVGVWGCWRESSLFVVAFNVTNYVIATFLGAVVFVSLHGSLSFNLHQITLELLVAGALANLFQVVSNTMLVSLGGRVKYGRPMTQFWREESLPFLRSLAILTALGLTVAALLATSGMVAVVLLFVPLFASQYMFKLLLRERRLVTKQKQLSDQYLEMNIGLAAAMVVLLDSKDEYTASHSAAVAMYCRDIAVAIGLPEADTEALHLAGLLHDLGKVGTPDAILRKDGPLDEEEWAFIRQHPAKGAEVLSHLAAYQDVAQIVRYHHERLDGSGYPDGVSGDEIPEMSKILAVADTYHAMTSNRPYHDALSSFEALKELRGLAGKTLDSRYVEVLAGVLRDKDLAYRDGTSTDFMDEYQRGRINLRLRGDALADLSGVAALREDPEAG